MVAPKPAQVDDLELVLQNALGRAEVLREKIECLTSEMTSATIEKQLVDRKVERLTDLVKELRVVKETTAATGIAPTDQRGVSGEVEQIVKSAKRSRNTKAILRLGALVVLVAIGSLLIFRTYDRADWLTVMGYVSNLARQ